MYSIGLFAIDATANVLKYAEQWNTWLKRRDKKTFNLLNGKHDDGKGDEDGGDHCSNEVK